MKKVLSLLLLIATLLVACKKEEKPEIPKPVLPSKEITSNSSACYSYIKNKDTIQANLIVQSGKVSGDLIYKLFEKDKNIGTIAGIMKGDTLFAEYTFMSEGTSSIREVAFLRKNNELIEGYGDMKDVAGKMVFKDKKSLNFAGSIILKETPCK